MLQILVNNDIGIESFLSAIYNALRYGRGKYRNVYIYGPPNCGKTFLLSPAAGMFAWLGIEKAEVVWLNDLRWKPTLIPWCELLQVLEGDIVHFSAPKNLMSQNVVLDKDTPFFATIDAPLALITGGTLNRINTEMTEGQMAHIAIAQANTQKPAGDKNMRVMFCQLKLIIFPV